MPMTVVPDAATVESLDAYLALPPLGDAPWPGVVVLHEAFGLSDDTRQQADRLAAAGYLAVAPNLFSAGGVLRCLRATFTDLTRGAGPAFDDIAAVRAWLAAREDCTGRIGVLGFCMGGGFALLAATHGFDVSAPNYGTLPKRADQVLRGACPVVASFGGRDRVIPDGARRLGEALTAAGVVHDVKEYPDAGHSFLNRHNLGPVSALMRVAGQGYHQPSAEDAWRRILQFFHTHLQRSEQNG